MIAAATCEYQIVNKLINEGMTESDFVATKSFLAKFVSLITDGQSRQLGYAIDSQYYQTEEFSDYIRDGLDNLTLDDVNRVIRENLNSENMQYVFITSDADDLRQRLVAEQSSPMTYDADLPQEVLDEDKIISELSLDFDDEKVTIVSADDVF